MTYYNAREEKAVCMQCQKFSINFCIVQRTMEHDLMKNLVLNLLYTCEYMVQIHFIFLNCFKIQPSIITNYKFNTFFNMKKGFLMKNFRLLTIL